MVETTSVSPFAIIGFIRAGHVSSIEPIILPYCDSDETDFEFLCGLSCHGSGAFE